MTGDDKTLHAEHARHDVETASGEASSSAEDIADDDPASSSRRRRMTIGIVAAAVVVLVAVVVAAAVYSEHRSHREPEERLSRVIEDAVQAGESADDFDALVEQCLSSLLDDLDGESVQTEYQDILPTVEDAEQGLSSARGDVEEAQGELDDEESTEAADQAVLYIDSRLGSITAGRNIMDAVVPALHEYELAGQGWDLVLSADDIIRTAAGLATETSADNVQSSMEMTTEAVDDLEQAAELLASAQDVGEADLDPYLEYVGLREEASRSALVSDQAYLDRDKDRAAEANDEYNALESQAAELFKAQADDPETLIEQDFRSKIAEFTSTYEEQCDSAFESHAFLLDYLGGVSK